MKYKIIGEKIRKDYKNYGILGNFCSWSHKVDGKIVEFKENEKIVKCDDYYISKDWCEPIENVSRETVCNNKNTIKKIKDYCLENIKRIDNMTETAITTDTDIGMNYAYRRILDIIESEVKTND